MNLELMNEGKIWQFKGKIILTDILNSFEINAVFPLCWENIFFIENLAVKENDVVLDLCTGSGILSIFAADKAIKVYATDINHRAIAFARLNSKLNNVENKIEFREGNLFDPVKGLKFDLILANPPFEPIPSGRNYYIHSKGGKRGILFLKKILNQIDEYVALNGSFQIFTWIPDRELGMLEKIDKKNYENLYIDTLKIYSWKEIHQYLKLRKQKYLLFKEKVHCVFIQAFNKKTEATTRDKPKIKIINLSYR